ncbi:hypothetical protein Tco_0551085 [Tanacetum coccineum]
MTKVIRGEFEKIKDVKVEYVSLTYDTLLEVFNNEVSRLSGMDEDLFTYEVKVANIPCNLNMDDDSKHEADDDMGYDLFDVAFTECEHKDEALRNKAIIEGFIKEDDDESHYKQERRWNIYTNYDDAYEIDHEDNVREELCEVHDLPVCNVRRYMLIKYLFNNNEEYDAVKEDKYDDLTITRKEVCQAYQEIFRIMDEGWKVTRTKE